MRIHSPRDGAKVHGLRLQAPQGVQAQLLQLAALVAGGCFEGAGIHEEESMKRRHGSTLVMGFVCAHYPV